jgi:DNA replication protein DnaC
MSDINKPINRYVRPPKGMQIERTPTLCEQCGDKPRTAGARTCLLCAAKSCVMMSSKGFEYFADGLFARARIVEMSQEKITTCESCYGSMEITYDMVSGNRTYTACAPCPGSKLQTAIGLFNASQCPARHMRAEFASFKPAHQSQAEAHRDLDVWSSSMKPGDKGWFLVGQSGVGKTHLLVAIAKRLTILRSIRVAYVDWSDLVSQLQTSLSSAGDVNQILERYATVPVLILDELGKGSATEWRSEVIENLIDRRYRNIALTTIVAANPGDIELSTKRNANATMRMKSRLMEVTTAIHVIGRDYRELGGANL